MYEGGRGGETTGTSAPWRSVVRHISPASLAGKQLPPLHIFLSFILLFFINFLCDYPQHLTFPSSSSSSSFGGPL